MLWSLAEIEADFLAIYGRDVDLMSDRRHTGNLSGPRFLNLCHHLPVYSGAVRNLAERWQGEIGPEPEALGALMLHPDLEVTHA